MTISPAVHRYLNRAGIPYDLALHERTGCAMSSARAAAIPPEQLAKGVLLRRADGYVLAAVPACCGVRLESVGGLIRQPVCLASEREVETLFSDCEKGAVPALGDPFGVQTIVDDRLEGLTDIYFEAGDHYALVHLKGADFDEITARALHAPIGMDLRH